MKLNKNHIEMRIAKLSTKPVENDKLIKKWKRYLRRAEAQKN